MSHCALVIKTLVVSDDCACDWSSYLWLHCAKKILHIMPALYFWKGDASAQVLDENYPY